MKRTTRRAVTLGGTSLALVGLTAGPALACWTATTGTASESAGSSSLSAFTWVERVDQALDGITARLSAGTTQWAETAPATVLTATQRRAALSDLWAAKAAGRALAVLDDKALTEAQQLRVDSLQARAASLVDQLEDLLDNRPDVAALVQPKLDAVSARTAADRAQWADVAAGTVLGDSARRAAKSDLRAARWGLAVVERVQHLTGTTADQRAQAAALEDQLRTLIGRLRTLLGNRPEAKPTDMSHRTGTKQVSFTRGEGTTRDHRCDRDGARFNQARYGGEGDGHRDRHHHHGRRA